MTVALRIVFYSIGTAVNEKWKTIQSTRFCRNTHTNWSTIGKKSVCSCHRCNCVICVLLAVILLILFQFQIFFLSLLISIHKNLLFIDVCERFEYIIFYLFFYFFIFRLLIVWGGVFVFQFYFTLYHSRKKNIALLRMNVISCIIWIPWTIFNILTDFLRFLLSFVSFHFISSPQIT